MQVMLKALHHNIIRNDKCDGTKVEKTQGWYMVKSLSTVTIAVHATKYPNVISV